VRAAVAAVGQGNADNNTLSTQFTAIDSATTTSDQVCPTQKITLSSGRTVKSEPAATIRLRRP
jgi:hypothetical protein